jgi:hypothetical protein
MACPNERDNLSATALAILSKPPPAATGAINLIGFTGYAGAAVWAEVARLIERPRMARKDDKKIGNGRLVD